MIGPIGVVIRTVIVIGDVRYGQDSPRCSGEKNPAEQACSIEAIRISQQSK